MTMPQTVPLKRAGTEVWIIASLGQVLTQSKHYRVQKKPFTVSVA